ncbi:DEAD/DEAH box helicase [Ammoniphilus oxalaticus]|uniref:DEAD/DEAH box helicase n=1 Tax=Ammoniphilus oxalaticus TaxID=66863 RepID=A0A419SQM0_9BACL|nr:DEAD/DEAH box helicase [Ammoniphilus oxalaticus]RKD26697.1 DEAD/DEAH box helicase [Ammoniphilus oxalaticus]
MKFVPHSYQAYAINEVIEKPEIGLFLDMGLGKTITTLTAVTELLHNYFSVHKVLVIAPKRVAEDTWSRETEKWQHTRYLKISKVLGPIKTREAALKEKADLYIINRENVDWLVKHYGKDWPFDMVVIDELSSFKSSASKRFKQLRKVRPLIKRIVGLTGTPAPNSLIDLWPQLYLLDRGERLGPTITGYRNQYFNPGRRDPSKYIVYNWVPKDGAEDAIHEQIGDICISMKAKDHLQLPERIDNVISVQLDPKEREIYKRLERDKLLEFDEQDVLANSAAGLMGKLLQLANGEVYDDEGDTVHIHDKKLDALEEVIEESQGQPILLFYSFKHDRDRILKRFKQAEELNWEDSIARWNKGEIPLLVAHPASAGHGLNLQDGGHIIVWFGLTWSLELYQQANSRLDRQGQKNSVIVHHLLVAGSVDEQVLNVLQGKEQNQDALLEAVKARIREAGGKA